MPITIDKAYIQTFESNVRLLAQQGETLLRSFVTEVQNQSESHNFDRLGSCEARDKVSARMESPAGGGGSGAVGSTDALAWDRRKTLIKTYDAGEIVEKEDPRQMLIDPNAPITRTLANAMKRKVDDVIIGAATGKALNGGGTQVNFPAKQVIGDGTGIITTDTLLEVNEKFLKNDIDPDEERVLVISPVQYRTLMNVEKLTSADYQSLKALSTGHLPNFMGFQHIILSNRLQESAGKISCLAFTRRGIGLHVARDIWGEVSSRPDMSYAWQFYTAMSIAAVRVEDEHVIHINLKNTAS